MRSSGEEGGTITRERDELEKLLNKMYSYDGYISDSTSRRERGNCCGKSEVEKGQVND